MSKRGVTNLDSKLNQLGNEALEGVRPARIVPRLERLLTQQVLVEDPVDCCLHLENICRWLKRESDYTISDELLQGLITLIPLTDDDRQRIADHIINNDVGWFFFLLDDNNEEEFNADWSDEYRRMLALVCDCAELWSSPLVINVLPFEDWAEGRFQVADYVETRKVFRTARRLIIDKLGAPDMEQFLAVWEKHHVPRRYKFFEPMMRQWLEHERLLIACREQMTSSNDTGGRDVWDGMVATLEDEYERGIEVGTLEPHELDYIYGLREWPTDAELMWRSFSYD